MTRPPIHHAAMSALVRAWWRRPFAWGSADCCTWAAACVQAATGRALVLPHWGSRLQAQRLQAHGGGLAIMVSAALGSPGLPGARPSMAAIGLHQQPGGPALAVWCGAAWLTPSAAGLVAIHPQHISHTWSVAHA